MAILKFDKEIVKARSRIFACESNHIMAMP